MKIHLKNSQNSANPRYLQRMKCGTWTLMQEEHGDFDWEIRELDEFESDYVESIFQHFAEPMKKLMGE